MVVIYLSPVHWDSIAQRPHFFANFIAQQGVEKLIWVDPLPSRFPKFSDIRTKLIGVESKSIIKPNNVEVIKIRSVIPIEPFNGLYKVINSGVINNFITNLERLVKDKDSMLIIGKPSVLSLKILERITFKNTIFDVMDDYPYFFKGKTKDSVYKLLKKLLMQVDMTMFSSSGLLHKYSIMTKKSILVMNACSSLYCNELMHAHNNNDGINDGIITYGYIGSVASWFDWDFIRKLSSSRPHSRIVIVGPLYAKPESIPPNVIIKPAIDHKDVPALIKTFDYGLIPFQLNQLTDSVDPVKYYEYVAAGVPVITTCFGEMKSRVNDKVAVTLEQHLSGIEPEIEKPIVWEDRFTFLIKGYLSAKEF
ncbi:hypothetical protein ABKV42_21640 [Enterobacter roggenkampii]|uniref:hypothetical protein n=1 Tax=Enterobacter roggenkampii TaxID=1812935 RepID=UPI0032AFA54A